MAELLDTNINGNLNIISPIINIKNTNLKKIDDSNILKQIYFKVNKPTLKTDFFKFSIGFNRYFNMEV